MTRLTRMLDAGDQVPDEVLLEELKENKLAIIQTRVFTPFLLRFLEINNEK